MNHRPDPPRIYTARHVAVLRRLTGPGMPEDMAEALVAVWEAHATALGRDPASAAFWDGSAEWIDMRRKRRISG